MQTAISKQSVTENALARIGNKLSSEDQAAINQRLDRAFGVTFIAPPVLCSECFLVTVLPFAEKCGKCAVRIEERREFARRKQQISMFLVITALVGIALICGWVLVTQKSAPIKRPRTISQKSEV